MAKVELKAPIVEEIKQNVEGAISVVLVDARGLTVEQDTKLRKELRDANVIYKVYKNTMLKRAFEGTDFSEMEEYLKGPSAIAISKDDVTAPARILYKYAKEIEALEFKAGVIEGKVCTVEEIISLANIPSREVLISKLLGSLQSPIANFARVIDQIAKKNPDLENGDSKVEAKEEAKAEEKEEVKTEEKEAKTEEVKLEEEKQTETED